jgi:protein involved in polysaccharide export with SLBB domain
MNFAKRLFIIAAAVLITSAAFAQLSDQQVIDELKKYSTSGKTQEQVLMELAGKGVTKEQLERIKKTYDAQSKGVQGTQTTIGESRERTENLNFPDPTKWDDIIKGSKAKKDSIFGKSIFSNENLTFQPNMNLPTPESYLLGSGDEVLIDIWGNSELNFTQKISPDGNIVVPNIGPIHLSGLQIREAKSRIKKAFSRIYSDLASAQPGTFIGVSLGKTRTIQVNVMGEVAVPGTYSLSSFATVFHALYSAGGINEIGSLRDIKVFRGGKMIAQVDVYGYLLKGDTSGEISLREGDLVKVEPYRNMVVVKGEVRRPMHYEMRDGESVATLLDFAGGFKGEAYKKNLLVKRKGESELKVYTVEAGEYSSFKIMDGDTVKIGAILDKYENKIEISGAVYRPGVYAIDNNLKTLKQLLSMAEGPMGDAYLLRAILYRENPDLSYSVESINVTKLLNGETPDITLRKNDRFYVPSVNELRDKLFVTLQGEVKNPDRYPYAHNATISDLILRGGGLLESASRARIDVSRRVKNPMSTSESPIQSEVFSFSLEKGLIITGDKEFKLQPFDIVTVRRSPGYEVQQNVTVRGEILFGGIYPKTKRDERISSLIQRAGGVTSSAYIQGARLTRLMNADERARVEATLKLTRTNTKDTIKIDSLDLGETYYVGIDLTKAMENPGGDEDIVLREGDVIDIPTYNGTVKISGAVMYPNAVTYVRGMTIGNYISNAGGLAFRGSKSKVYVVYMNGKVSKGLTSHIEPGCEIIIPLKPERKGTSLAEIMGLSTSAASIALMVTTLLKP